MSTSPSRAVSAYVESLGRAIPGRSAVRRRLLQEVRDGLSDAELAYRRAAYDPEDAADLAVAEFGQIDELAPMYVRAVTLDLSRRTSRSVTLTLLGVFGCWQLTLSTAAIPAPTAPGPATLSVCLAGMSGVTVILAAFAFLLSRRRVFQDRQVATLAALSGVVATSAGLFAALGLATLTAVSGGRVAPTLLVLSSAALALPCRQGWHCMTLARRPAARVDHTAH